MRPAEFSPEEIVAAGEALVAAGRNVTGFALRQKVGGGNPNRLKQVWDEHLAAKNTTEAEPVAELPVEVALDKVCARFENGILTLQLPKQVETPAPHRVTIE